MDLATCSALSQHTAMRTHQLWRRCLMRGPRCVCVRADPEEPSEVPAGGAAVEAAAERVPPRRVRPPLRLRLLAPARLRRPDRLGPQHPQAARPAGRRAGRAGLRGHARHQLRDCPPAGQGSSSQRLHRTVPGKLRICSTTWREDVKIFMSDHRSFWVWTPGSTERPRVLRGTGDPCVSALYDSEGYTCWEWKPSSVCL